MPKLKSGIAHYFCGSASATVKLSLWLSSCACARVTVNNAAASNGVSSLQRCRAAGHQACSAAEQRGIKLAALQNNGVFDPRGSAR